jgi:hypothetical protein
MYIFIHFCGLLDFGFFLFFEKFVAILFWKFDFSVIFGSESIILQFLFFHKLLIVKSIFFLTFALFIKENFLIRNGFLQILS